MGGVKIYYIFEMLSMWPLVVVFINLIFIKMKFNFKVLVLLTLMALTQERADAYLVHGAASIVWNGNPWTSTSGTVHCSSDMMQICCSIVGSSIAINIGGHWWWGTLERYYDPNEGSNPWYEFTSDGLEEGPEPN